MQKFDEVMASAGHGTGVTMKRCVCGKLLKVIETTSRWYSGIVNYDETLCRDCRKEFEDKPRIICLGCKTLQGFMEPQRAKTGFVFERRKHYHIEKCPKCEPLISATPILEHELFCRERKIVTVKDLDLVQDIEQKTLQGKREADKLRRELQARPTQ